MTTATASPTFSRSDILVVGGAVLMVAFAGAAHYAGWSDVIGFVACAVAVTLLATLVGRSVEQFGDRFGPGATGVLQSALGNLPELFISIFALRAGLVDVVKAALIGSILANLLLVLGLAFVVGGIRHGRQKLDSQRARTLAALMVLSVAAMAIPSLAHGLHTPATDHEKALSIIVAIVLLALYGASLPALLSRGHALVAHDAAEPPRWPIWLAITVLAVSSGFAAFVSDWFVDALQPAMHSLGVSQVFAGLVVVAIAGNAIENVVGVHLAAKNRSEYAFAVILASPIQISLVLAPALVLISVGFGLTTLTLVFSPLLVACLLLSVVLTTVITIDGESDWLEGVALIALYVVIASAFWWG